MKTSVRLCLRCERNPRAIENTPAMVPDRKWAADWCASCYEEQGWRFMELSEGVSRWMAPRVIDPLPDELLFHPDHDLNGIRISSKRWSQ
jgi:hypothetical protein